MNLIRSRSKNPAHLLLLTLDPQTGLILKQRQDLGWKVQHSGFYEIHGNHSQIDEMPFVAQQLADASFAEKFEKRFKHPYHSRAPHAYEITRLILDTLNAVPEPRSAGTMAAEIMTLRERPSVLGPLNVSATRNIENKPVWLVSREGKFVRYPDR